MADFRHGPVAVVGDTFQHERYTVRPVAFINDFFKYRGFFIFAGATFDGTLDIFLGHVAGPGFFNCQRQLKIAIGVASTCTRRHDDFACQAGKSSALLGVCRTLLAADGCPMAVSRHISTLL